MTTNHNGGLAPISPAEFASRAREIVTGLEHDPDELRREWMRLAVMTLYSIGYGDGVDVFDQAMEDAP